MINNRYMTNEEIVDKLIEKTIQSCVKFELNQSNSKRDMERFNNIRLEILSRMNNIEDKAENIMTPEHSEWEAFCEMLCRRLDITDCDSESLTQSVFILKNFFPNINIEKTIEYFVDNGGFCDCEVLINVDKE